MRPATARRTPSPWKTVSLVLATLVIGGAGTVGGLVALGAELPFDLPFLKRAPDTTGLIPVPQCSQAIPAYTKITRDHLLDPQTGRVSVMFLPPGAVQDLGLITEASKIIGRVMGHDKAVGYTFREEDFLPRGTRPGLVAGIPGGKRAVTVDAAKLPGLHALQAGDRLDILSTLPIDLQKVFSQSKAKVASGLQVGLLAQQKTAAVRVLVQNAALVVPITTRVIPIASSSLTQGAVTRTKPIQEAVIAVDPEEIAPLSEALAVAAELVCVARSGLPDDPGPASVTPPGVDVTEQVAAVETLIGGRHEVVYVPKTPAVKKPRTQD